VDVTLVEQSGSPSPGDAAVQDAYAVLDGARVHYRHAGAGYPLILLHGLVGSARNWEQNLAQLGCCSSVYALDLCNMGQSDRVPGLDAGLEATADRVAAWMDAAGVERADVAGHSHGGAVAMMFAARHPGRLRRLILFAPANPYCDLGRPLIDFYQTRPGRLLARAVPWLPRRIKSVALARMYGDPGRIPAAALDGYIAGLRVPGTMEHILAIIARWRSDMQELRQALPGLAKTPVLMVWGDRDRAVALSSATRLKRIFSRSELLVLPGVAHIPFEEEPEACNRALREWLLQPMVETA